jgi:methylmalonyl-CoA mutase N-terminal domain/subunit
LREERDNPLVKEKLDQLAEVATRKSLDNRVNIVPSIKEAVKAYATVGEIYGVLRRIYGEFGPPTHM